MSGTAKKSLLVPAPAGSLQKHTWQRFLSGPDAELLDKLYVPGLRDAVRYDRCCAYFSSSVLAAAARGFAGLIERLVEMGEHAPRPAVRLVVNEEMSQEDVRALLETGDTTELERQLLKRLVTPREALVKHRLAMLSWLAKSGLLELRVGIMRQGQGLVHAKFGLIYDAAGDAVVFNGSGNESAHGLCANYERLELSTSWSDPERYGEYRDEFGALWSDAHPHVHTIPLPDAVEQKLLKFAPVEPPLIEPSDNLERRKAAMLWRFIAEAPYLPDGASCCEATAPLEELWPHQRRVIEEVSNAWPEGRLLCDEVGMGKTIEAIMILRRLLAGRGVRRVLFLLPAGLTTQWQEELREKGGLVVPRLEGTNTLVWPDGRREKVADFSAALKQDLLIVSRETARRENFRGEILAAEPWDIVLLDEAHAARRAKQEEGEFNAATLLLELLRQMQIAGATKSFLLLSATPMQTAAWEPWDLLAVLGEGGAWLADFRTLLAYYNVIHGLEHGNLLRLPPGESRRAAWLACSDKDFPKPPDGFTPLASDHEGDQRLRHVLPSQKAAVSRWLRRGSPLARRMHRNTRNTLRQYHKRGLSSEQPPSREVIDRPYNYQPLDGPERQLYDAIEKYIDKRFDELEREKPGKGFVMTIYRRRAASSPHALRQSLERRLTGLNQVVKQHATSEYMELQDEPERLIDADLPEDIDPGKIPSSLPTNPEDAKKEAHEVSSLLQRMQKLGLVDTKRDRFFELVKQLVNEGRPVLIFTEYADTMEYLREPLADAYGDQVASYCGSGGAFYQNGRWRAASKKEITDALQSGRIRFLVCTDAASEGLNLQAASALINYDLPWNPSRVEQRIGRIDRIGQKEKVVKIYNFLLKDSIDEQVYMALELRCGLFKRFVGPMQPVLSRARKMLNSPREFSLRELEEEVKKVEKDAILAETYLDSEAVPLDLPTAPVSRHDVRAALSSLKEEFGLKVKMGDVVEIKGLQSKVVRLALDSESLDSEPRAVPLTALNGEVAEIASRLTRPGELLPLVVGTYRSGAFRSACVMWVNEGGTGNIKTIADLKSRLETWNGDTPSAERLNEAEQVARGVAGKHVKTLIARAEAASDRMRDRQQAAARVRTARELGRLLKCLDPQGASMSAMAKTQASLAGALSPRVSSALDLLGNGFKWTDYLNWEIEEYFSHMSATDKKSRLSGSSLDAALSDYRWRVE